MTNFNLQLFAEQKEFTLSDFKEGKLEVEGLKAGDTVIIKKDDSEEAIDTFVAGADGTMVFVNELHNDNGRMYVGLVSGTIKLEKQSKDENYSGGYNVQRAYLYSVHEDTEHDTSVDGSMLIGNNSNQDITVAVNNGIVMSVRGLGGEHGKGTFFEERFTVANRNNAIRYIVTDETGHIIRQTTGLFDKDWNYKELYASYTILDNVGDEIVGATYYEKDSEKMPADWNEKINAAMSSVIDEDKDPVGAINKAEGPFQLKWDEKSVGLFKVNVSKNKVLEAVIDAQTKENNGDKKDLTPKAGTYYWMKAGVKVDADGKEMLVIVPKVRQVTANGTYKDLDLGTNHGWSAKSSVTINAPAYRGINFVNNLNTKVVLNNVAAGSIIKGICIGDEINTTSLMAGDAISFEYTVGDNKYTYTYTAAGAGPLVFQGAGKKYKDENGKEQEFRGAALVSGAVKLAGLSEGSHDCTRATCAGPVASDAKQDFVIQNYSKSDIVVTAANGKVSSITGLKDDGYVRVYESNGKMTDYTYVAGEVPVIKRETFDLDKNEEPISDSVVTEIYKVNTPEGLNLRSVGYAYTKITGLDFTKNGTSAAYYSLAVSGNDSHGGNANEDTKVTKESVTPDSKDPGLAGVVINEDYFLAKAGEAYLKVTANTAEQVTTLQVDVMYAKDNGELKASPEQWDGRLTLTGIKNAAAAAYGDKYAVLKYAKPKNAKWKLSIENAALGSNITGLGKEDYIDTAATGDKAVTLKKGTYDIYQTKKDDKGQAIGMETRTLSVEGSVDVKVNENGQVTSLSGLEKGEKVTLSEKTADGQKTISYEYVGNAYIKTEVLTDSRKKATMTQYKTEEAVSGTDVMAIENDAWKSVSDQGQVSGKVILNAMQSGKVSQVVCAGANENDVTDNIVIMNYSAKDDVTVNVARGKVTSITGLQSEDNYIIVREGAVDIRYTCLGENHNVFKKEIGTYDDKQNLFVPSEKFEDTTYMQTSKGGNIYTKAYALGKWTALTDLKLDKAGKTTAYYSRGGAGVVKITKDNFGKTADSKSRRGPVRTDDKGTFFGAVSTEAYLSVTATTDRNLVSTVKVDVLRASADGVLKSVRGEGWSGAVEINGLLDDKAADYDKKYAVLKYAKPANYKAGVYEDHVGNAVNIKNAAIGSVFTGYNEYDSIETAATGETAVKLKQGNYNIYHTTKKNDKENTIQVRNLAVTGTVNVKTNTEGELTYLGEVLNAKTNKFDTYKVTMKEGKLTTTYEFTRQGTYVKTITEVGGPTLQYTAKSLKNGYTTLNMDTDGDTILKVTGAKAGSTYDLGAGDTLATGSLKIGEQITVNGTTYTAAAAGRLSFDTVKAGNAVNVQLTAGTVKLGKNQSIVACGKTVMSTSDDITVMAAGKNYTIGGLTEGASFSVDGKVYTKVGNNVVTEQESGIVLYNIGRGKNITKANLDSKTAWKTAAEAKDEYGKASIDLALTDKNVKTGEANYVLDKYVVKTARPNKNAMRNAAVTTDAVSKYQDKAGTVAVTETSRTYTAVGTYGQIIKVTDKWTVNAGAGDDKITGAMKGEDTLNAGAGNNIIELKAANDTVIIGAGHDEIKGYTSGKDKLVLKTGTANEEPHFIVDKTDLYITKADVKEIDKAAPNYYAVVRGAANGKAVMVNGQDYYFGKNINAKDSHNGVSVKSMSTGLTFTGSKYDDVIDLTASDKTRDYITTGINQGNDVVKGFGVNDVIKLNGLTNADIAKLKNMTSDGLTSALSAGLTFEDGGKLTVSTNAGVKVKFQNNTLVSTK